MTDLNLNQPHSNASDVTATSDVRLKVVIAAIGAIGAIVPAAFNYMHSGSTGSGVSGDGSDSRQAAAIAQPAAAPVAALFVAAPTEITPGTEVELSWQVQNAVRVDIEPNVSSGAGHDGRVRVKPATSTTYRLEAKGADGTVLVKTQNVSVTSAPPQSQVSQAAPYAYELSVTRIEAQEVDGRGEESWRFEILLDNQLAISIPEMKYRRRTVIDEAALSRATPAYQFRPQGTRGRSVIVRAFKRLNLQATGTAMLADGDAPVAVPISVKNDKSIADGSFAVFLRRVPVSRQSANRDRTGSNR